MKISDVARMTGVTVRTLHYYDEIGLLKPSEVTEAGYRVYLDESLEILQQILFFKELDFPLVEIKEIMMNESYDKNLVLQRHREILIKKRDRLNRLINLLDSNIEGERKMSFNEFDMSEIENSKKKYAKEAKDKWGSTDVYKEFEKKSEGYNMDKWQDIDEAGKIILKKFGENRNIEPDSEIAQNLVLEWKNYISKNFYECNVGMLSCLGLMYIDDERFKENIDKNGEGTAQFIADAIECYCLENN